MEPIDKLTPEALDAAVGALARASEESGLNDEFNQKRIRAFFTALNGSPQAKGLLVLQAKTHGLLPDTIKNVFLMAMIIGWDLRGNIQEAESLEAMLDN